MNRRKALLLKTFSRQFFREAGAVQQLRAMETYKKNRYKCLFLFINNVDLKNKNRNYRKSFWIFRVPE